MLYLYVGSSNISEDTGYSGSRTELRCRVISSMNGSQYEYEVGEWKGGEKMRTEGARVSVSSSIAGVSMLPSHASRTW